MFSIGFLSGFLVGLLLLVTALVASKDSHGHHDHHARMRDRMHGDMLDRMYGDMLDRMHGDTSGLTPGDSRRDTLESFSGSEPDRSHSAEGFATPSATPDATASWERERRLFEEFINLEREMFKKRLASLPKEQQAAEQRAFDSWLKDRQAEFSRNNPRP